MCIITGASDMTLVEEVLTLSFRKGPAWSEIRLQQHLEVKGGLEGEPQIADEAKRSGQQGRSLLQTR